MTTFPLDSTAQARLRELLGDSVQLIDIRDADGAEGLVIVPSVSQQLIGKLSSAFPSARIVVIEFEDAECGVNLGGPVSRALDAGADGYAVARSIEEFAALVHRIRDPRASLIRAERPAALMAAEQQLEDIVDVILRRQAEQEPARRREGRD